MSAQKGILEGDLPGTALITGASAGMGTCFAKQLAQKGFDIVLVARRKDRLERLAAELSSDYSVSCEVFAADLAKTESIQDVSDHIRRMENLDLLINNAGFATLGYFADVSFEKTMRMFHLHTQAPVSLAYAALEGMLKRRRGAIVNVASLAAFAPTPGNTMYNATKAFLTAFSESLQLEVKDAGIRVQALCPGFTRTEFHEVGDFRNFDRSVISKGVWMSADEVVALSLEALASGKKPIFIPGWKNRLFVWLVRHSSTIELRMQKRAKDRDRKMLGR